MNNKNLKIRYFFYFILSFFLLILTLNNFEEKKFEDSLENYKKFVSKEYSIYFNNYKNNSELIYFNEFIKEKKLIEILKNKNNLDLTLLSNEIYNNFENSFIFYKTLGLEEASFYSTNNDLILSMKENSKDNFTSKTVENVIKNKKELSNYKLQNNKILLQFSKPIFDEKLEFIGVINLEFNFDLLIKELEKETNLNYREVISDNFHLNEDFFFNISKNKKEKLFLDLNNKKEILFFLKENKTKIPIIFIPLYSSDFYKNNIYLLAYDKDKNNELAQIDEYVNNLLLILILVLLFIFFLLFRANYLKMQRNISNKKYQELFNQIDNYIIKVETDLDGNIIFATKPFYKLSGYSKEEVIGKNINILKHSDVSKIFFENLWKDLKISKIWEGEIKNQDKFGNSYWVKAVIFPRYDNNNEIEGYSSIRVNITDTKQLEKINRLLKEDLSNKLNDIKIKDKSLVDTTKVQLMSKILDSLAHQWKIPISKISFEIQKLNKIKNINLDKNSLFDIEKNVETELKNLSDMLNEIKYLFSTRNREKTNLLSVVSESIFSLKEELKNQNIKVKFDIKPEINMNISFNELKNIIMNIIKNTIEYSKLNSEDNVTIYITAIFENTDKQNDVIIKIEDNIKGINKKNIINEILNSEEKYFDTPLYLSKLFIEKNKGLFWCNNNEYYTIYYIKLDKEEN